MCDILEERFELSKDGLKQILEGSSLEEKLQQYFTKQASFLLYVFDIYEEVKEDIRDAAVKEAEEIIDEKAGLKRIDEFKKLMINGFIVAAFVGLLVNQLTNIIGFYKGSVSIATIMPTVIISAILFVICISIFTWLFLNELLRLLKKHKNM